MTNEKLIEKGRMLFQSAENLQRSASKLDALMDTFWEILEDEKPLGEIAELDDEDAGGDGKWLAHAYAYNAGILSRPARAPGQKGRTKQPKQIGTVSIITRLCNPKTTDEELPDWPWLGQACLIVGWHPKQNPDDWWGVADFDPTDANLASIVHLADGLWAWCDDDTEYAYFFVLPIFALTNEDVLKREAVRPLKTLFNTDEPASMAKEAFRDVSVLLPLSG